MSVIRHMRRQAGLTQTQMAKRAGTSQPTIAAYEGGTKSPTLSTLQNLAASLGLELTVIFTPAMTREDRRSLAYHRAVAEVLRRDPDSARKLARRNLKTMTSSHVGPEALFKSWSEWLSRPLEELILRMLDPSQEGRDLRQVSPFAGLLSSKERIKVINQFRKDER
ncbi:MAG: helix-turn-helix transcriptional regulator [Deltaproteobacteria bacterium]|nr:helix-turn-helix transcriptional regulator [Deltaproteobacteria bacterium]